MREKIKVVVFDCDGTLTDVEEEGKPYREGFLNDLATLTGFSIERIRELALRFEAQVAADPTNYGWIYNGQIVAPATVDPYLRMAPVARMILKESGLELPVEFVDRLFTGLLYRYNYAKTVGATCFRAHARATLNMVGHSKHVYIVTNSGTEDVQKKVRLLSEDGNDSLEWLVPRVYGNAKKYVVIAGSVAGIDDAATLPGLSRPVLLHRSHYYRVLDAIRMTHGVEWSEMAVVGDIFELDLALPCALGCSIILAANEHTPAYERDFVAAAWNGRVVNSLREVWDHLA